MLVKKLNFQHDNVSATLLYFKGLSIDRRELGFNKTLIFASKSCNGPMKVKRLISTVLFQESTLIVWLKYKYFCKR